jgi:hypothetical protein
LSTPIVPVEHTYSTPRVPLIVPFEYPESAPKRARGRMRTAVNQSSTRRAPLEYPSSTPRYPSSTPQSTLRVPREYPQASEGTHAHRGEPVEVGVVREVDEELPHDHTATPSARASSNARVPLEYPKGGPRVPQEYPQGKPKPRAVNTRTRIQIQTRAPMCISIQKDRS